MHVVRGGGEREKGKGGIELLSRSSSSSSSSVSRARSRARNGKRREEEGLLCLWAEGKTRQERYAMTLCSFEVLILTSVIAEGTILK